MATRLLGLLCCAHTIAAAVRLVTERHSNGHEDLAVRGEQQPRDAEAVRPGVRHEEIFDVGQGVGTIEPAPSEDRRSYLVFTTSSLRHRLVGRVWLQVREVDQPVLRKTRMHCHVPEAKPASRPLTTGGMLAM